MRVSDIELKALKSEKTKCLTEYKVLKGALVLLLKLKVYFVMSL